MLALLSPAAVTSNATGAYTASGLGPAAKATSTPSKATSTQINTLLNKVSDRTDKALEGVAMAFAMADTPTFLQSETFAMRGTGALMKAKTALP